MSEKYSKKHENKKPLKLTNRGKVAFAGVAAVAGLGALEAATGSVSQAASASVDRVLSMPTGEQPDPIMKARMERDIRADELEKIDAATVCIPSKETMKFVFKVGLTESDVVKQMHEGVNDACYDEAVELVHEKVEHIQHGGAKPWVGDQIEVPTHMIHQPKN